MIKNTLKGLHSGETVICNTSYEDFKKGEVGVVEHAFYGENMYYTVAQLSNERTANLETDYVNWDTELTFVRGFDKDAIESVYGEEININGVSVLSCKKATPIKNDIICRTTKAPCKDNICTFKVNKKSDEKCSQEKQEMEKAQEDYKEFYERAIETINKLQEKCFKLEEKLREKEVACQRLREQNQELSRIVEN